MKKSYGCSSSKCDNNSNSVRTVVTSEKSQKKRHIGNSVVKSSSLPGFCICDGMDYYRECMGLFYDDRIDDYDCAGEELREIVKNL